MSFSEPCMEMKPIARNVRTTRTIPIQTTRSRPYTHRQTPTIPSARKHSPLQARAEIHPQSSQLYSYLVRLGRPDSHTTSDLQWQAPPHHEERRGCLATTQITTQDCIRVDRWDMHRPIVHVGQEHTSQGDGAYIPQCCTCRCMPWSSS